MPDPATPTIGEPDLNLAPVVVADASSTPEELDAKISEELGIPPAKPAPAPETVSEPTDDVDEPARPVETEETNEETNEDEEVSDPEPAEPARPSDEDLFVEIEDANGVTHKISKIEDLPEDFEPRNNRQALEILRATERLDQERQVRADQAAKDEETQLIKDTQTAQFESWDVEIAELAKTKRIDIGNIDYLNDVFGHMNQINSARTKAGNPNLISSFEDALDKYEAKLAVDKAETDKKNGNAAAKAKTAIIGKSSAAAGGDHYVYRAGSARSIDDIPL